MKLEFARNGAATIILFTHLAAILYVFFGKSAVLELSERIEIVLLLSPLTGVFALAAVRHVMTEARRRRSRRKVSYTFAFFALGIPAIFGALILFCIATYPEGFEGSIERLRITLSAIEVVIGGLIGAISDELFQRSGDD